MTGFNPIFTVTNRMTSTITRIARARGVLEVARLSGDWVRDMETQALIKEAHHTTHIEGTRLTLYQAERLWKGETVPEADPGNYRRIQDDVADSSTGEFMYTPPSAVEVPVMMAEMVTWLNSYLEIHPVSVVEYKTHESKKTTTLNLMSRRSETFEMKAEQTEVPALRGCHTQAKSLDTLMKRVKEAIELCLETENPVSNEFIGVQKVVITS